MAQNIKKQPKISRAFRAPPVRFQPRATKTAVERAANTDSRLIRIDAEVGSVYF